MKKPYLLVQVDPPTMEFCGDHYYRTFVPLFALGNSSDNFYTVSFTNEHRLKSHLLKIADVVVLNLVADMDLIPLVEERRRKGLVTVYEWNDDVYNIPPWNPQYRFFSQPHIRCTMERLARLCDAVQFSSTVLEEGYKWLNEKRVVFMNHLLPLSYQPSFYKDGDLVELGYGGSAGHLYDVASIAPFISKWLCGEKRVRLNIMAARPIVELFRSVPGDKIRIFPTGSIFDYYGFLRNLHIGLSPLIDIPFNRARSDVKFLEYAIHGIVPVLQKIEPYSGVVIHEKTGFLFESVNECMSILYQILKNTERMKLVAMEARNYVLRERMMFQHVNEREQFYLELIKRKVSGNYRAYSAFSSLKNIEGAKFYGDYVILMPTTYEILLREGLGALSEGDRIRARECFRKATELSRNYLAYLYLAECSSSVEERLQHLRMALGLNSRSLMARLMLKTLQDKSLLKFCNNTFDTRK